MRSRMLKSHMLQKLWAPSVLVLLTALVAGGCDDGDSEADPTPDRGLELPDAEVVVPDAEVPEADAEPQMPDAELVEPDEGIEEPTEDLTLNSIIPPQGVVTGGTEVRIIGSGFYEGLNIRFDNIPCQSLEIESLNRARCVTPPGTVGTAAVTAVVQAGDGLQNAELEGGFTYFEQVVLFSVEPNRSPLRGGVPLTISGAGLVEGSRVTIGDLPVPMINLEEDGDITLLAPPAMDPGPVDVTVTNPNGQATLQGALFYYEGLQLDALEPPLGPVSGGTPVQLLGNGLRDDSRITFGDRPAEALSAEDGRTRLLTNAPPAAEAGPVDVTVENENGTVVLSRGFVYFDDNAPGFSVSGVVPEAGPVEGGNDIFVGGTGFTAETEVAFDGATLNCETLDANRIRCTAPPRGVGPVDVQVADPAGNAILADGYTYFETLNLFAVSPERGSVAGGTVVTLVGTGFTADMEVDFGGLALQQLEIIDESTVIGVTPANTSGPITVGISTPYARSRIEDGYTYFNPINRFGGVWGEVIDGAVNITVLNSNTGQPEPEVAALAITEDEAISLEGLTNENGQLTLSTPGLRGPLNITAAKAGFEVTTVEDVEAENVTIYLIPNESEDGDPPPGVPAAILRGTVTGLDALPKPVNERFVNVIVVETTHTTPYNRNRLPPPGANGLLFEDGPFEIIARPGELAIVATAGELDRQALANYQEGTIDYWTMRQSLNPLAMGLRRFISASPGQEIDDLNVFLDHRMDLDIPVDLDNPPAGPDPGPSFYACLPRLNLGAEGYWELDTQAVSVSPALDLRRMPGLDGWDADITYYLIGLGFSATADNTPMSVTIAETRDIEAGVLITPFIGAPILNNPLPGQSLGPGRLLSWTMTEGFEGPIRQNSASLILIEEPQLGPPKPLWRYVTPAGVTEVELPPLPRSAQGAGLGNGVMLLTVLPFIVDANFDFDDFTYDDLNQLTWRAWSQVNSNFFQ
ncbi:MAG: IPT/TIG domain-containing protein [Bradymonadia bacterium]